jgi:hypothetical protein
MALFPIPLITNLPLLFKMAVTAFSKEASMYLFNSTKASDSIANAFFAMVIMFSFIFDFSYWNALPLLGQDLRFYSLSVPAAQS